MKPVKVISSKSVLLLFLMILGAGYVSPAQERETKQNPVPPPPRAVAPQTELPAIDAEYLELVQGADHLLPLCAYLFGHIGQIPGFADHLFDAFARSQQNIPELFHYTHALHGAKAGGYGPPLSGTWRGKTIGTEADIAAFFELEGVGLVHPEEWKKLPFSFRKGIIEFLFYADRAKTVIDQYIQPVVSYLHLNQDDDPKAVFEKLMSPWKSRELASWETIEAIGLADKKKLSYASRIAAEKLQWFLSQSGSSIPDDFAACSITSCMGECLISGKANDTINGGVFCVIELGGDDVYPGNAASPVSVQQPMGIVIDLEGNDKYLCDDGFLASGVLGLGFLLDLKGDDIYRTSRPGSAFSLYGSSLLYDLAGDDVYISEGAYAQASAFVGTSLLIDVSGHDKYSCASSSQGFGGTRGVSVFYDGSGDDEYNLDKTAPAFVQGAAKGRWAEATDGQSLAGGIGIFFDRSGTDQYNAGSFSQGASYYFGLGVFSDGKGDDTYNAVSHSQGYAAHYALAGFFERSGNDSYNNATDTGMITQITGSGRDNSAGLFIDRRGDDVYNFGNRSAGIGDLNGIGVLKDLAGSDTYCWHKNRVNAGAPSLGKTIDVGSGMGLSFKAIPPGRHAKGIFFDSNGDKPTEN